jgi:hypothetical protein
MDKDSAPTDDIDDIYRAYEARLREESKKEVNVSIKSPYLLNEDKTRLTSQIQQVIGEELAKNNEAKLQSLKERLQASKKSFPGSIEEFFSGSIEEREAIVRLEGLNLPEENKNRLTSQIQQMIGEELAKNAEVRQTGRTYSCICAIVGYTGPPGEESYLWHRPLTDPPGPQYFPLGEDTVTVFRDTRENLPKTEMKVGLKLKLRSNWSKEIWAFDHCRTDYPGVARIYCHNNQTPTQWMDLHSGCYGGDTIVFRKPRFGGAWWDMYHLHSSAESFWKSYGGTRLWIRWDEDQFLW